VKSIPSAEVIALLKQARSAILFEDEENAPANDERAVLAIDAYLAAYGVNPGPCGRCRGSGRVTVPNILRDMGGPCSAMIKIPCPVCRPQEDP